MNFLEEELRCSICFEIFICPTVVSCGHIFCKTCINAWSRKKKECPVCMTRIKKSKMADAEVIIDRIMPFMSTEVQEERRATKRKRAVGTEQGPRPPKMKRRVSVNYNGFITGNNIYVHLEYDS